MRFGRSLSALIVALLCVALAAPASASFCEPAKGHCVGMPAAMKALCARMGPAMGDCCHKQQQSTPARPAPDEQAPNAAPDATATLPVAEVPAPASPTPVAVAFSRDAALHELGLFTLHSVFRI
jgi:hypothetical protein